MPFHRGNASPSGPDQTPAAGGDPASTALPAAAAQRIERLAATESQGAFTSDLSVDEHLLVTQSGFEPVGYVMGTSIYHVGLQVAGVEPVPGVADPHASDVQREGAGDRADEDRSGRPSRRRHRRRRSADPDVRLGSRRARVRRAGHRREVDDPARGRRSSPTAARSPPTSPGRTSSPSFKVGTSRSRSCSGTASTT